MKSFKALFLHIFTLLGPCFGTLAQSTVSTPIVGFNTLSFPSGNSNHAATFVKGNVFQGAATSKTTNSLTIS